VTTARGDFAVNRRILLLSAIAFVIGIGAALIAKLLLILIALFTNLFYFAEFSSTPHDPSMEHWGAWFILVPVVGALIIGLMARFGSEKIRGHGIPEALEAILFGKSIVHPKIAILKPLSSAISIGSGGPFGAEGPIIMTGGAFGSLIAQFLKVTAAERKALLTAGAAAGMSAVFATPIAAVLLAVELLLFEWKPRSLVPVAVASLVAAVVRIRLMGPGPLFPVPAHDSMSEFMLFEALMAGLIAGIVSTLLSKSLYKLEDLFQQLPIHWMWWPALGGAVVGIGGYIDPRALGVGYGLIGQFLGGHVPHVGQLVLVKAAIWLVALASGTSGGVLAPLLIFGCALGSVESHWFAGNGSSATWSLISMGAIMGGMMRSPFTAILFSFELTRDADALLPVTIASFASYLFTVLVMKRSILTEKIARRGYDLFREYSVDPLECLTVGDMMTKDPKTISSTVTLTSLLNEKFLEAHHSGLPVVQPGSGKLVGIVTAADLERVPGLDSPGELTVKDMIQRKPITVSPFKSCREAADLMAEHQIGRLLVVEPSDPEKLLGIFTRGDLLKARKKQLDEESKREQMVTLKSRRLTKLLRGTTP
jgi:H+/Cl- antiporter ClcA/CBS domain-containing protein